LVKSPFCSPPSKTRRSGWGSGKLAQPHLPKKFWARGGVWAKGEGERSEVMPTPQEKPYFRREKRFAPRRKKKSHRGEKEEGQRPRVKNHSLKRWPWGCLLLAGGKRGGASEEGPEGLTHVLEVFSETGLTSGRGGQASCIPVEEEKRVVG